MSRSSTQIRLRREHRSVGLVIQLTCARRYLAARGILGRLPCPASMTWSKRFAKRSCSELLLPNEVAIAHIAKRRQWSEPGTS